MTPEYNAALKRILTVAKNIPAFPETQYRSPEEYANIAKRFLLFIGNDFKETLWKKNLYNWLSCQFGHIAHYNLNGFWKNQFSTRQQQTAFVRQVIDYPFYSSHNPEHTLPLFLRQTILNSGILSSLSTLAQMDARNIKIALVQKLQKELDAEFTQQKPSVLTKIHTPTPQQPPAPIYDLSGQASLF